MKKLQAKTHTYKQPMALPQALGQDRQIFNMSNDEKELEDLLTEVDILKHNVFELNSQLYNAYKRIKELRDIVDKNNTLN